MTSGGLANLEAQGLYQEYLRRIDCEKVLDHYGARNAFRVGDEVQHSCLLDRVDPHHNNGDENPSARMNLEKKSYICIGPGAWVMTPEGGKPIEDLVVGDRVLTHRGRYRHVTRTYSRYVDDTVIEYRPVGSRPFLITKDHKMWTAKRGTCSSCSKSRGCRHAPVGELEWNRGVDIEGHVVARGFLSGVLDKEFLKVLQPIVPQGKWKATEVAVTPDFMRFLGYYLSEGHVNGNAVVFTFSPQEAEYAQDAVSLAESIFGLIASVGVYQAALRVTLSSRRLAAFVSELVGSGCDQKLLPEWTLTLPVHKQRELLRGLYRGDGSVSANHQSVLALSNRELIYQVWQILTRFSARTGLSHIAPKPFAIGAHDGVARPQGRIVWSDDCSADYRHINDKSRYPYREVPPRHSRYWTAPSGHECVSATYREVPYAGMVFDIEVEEDHSFVVEGVVSSNCYSYGGGSIFWLIAKMEGKEHFHEIAHLLGPFLNGAVEDTVSFMDRLRKFFETTPPPAPPTYGDQVLRPWLFPNPHPYLTRERGISPEAARLLSLGYDERECRIVFPHWAEVNGVVRLVGWQKRALLDPRWPQTQPDEHGNLPKMKSSAGMPKHNTLYNLHRVKERGLSTAVVMESPISVAMAETHRQDETELLAGCVATFGSKVTDEQVRLLSLFRKVYVYMDDDRAGRESARSVVERLWRNTEVMHVEPEPGKDMADYRDRESILSVLAQAEPAHRTLNRWKQDGYFTTQGQARRPRYVRS